MFYTILAVFLCLPLQVQAETIGFSLEGTAQSAGVQVTVIDDLTGIPIPDAQISVGELLSYDAHQNLPLTGTFALPKVVSIFKEGYTAMSIVGVQSEKVTAYLKPLNSQVDEVIASGEATGWDLSAGDSIFAGLIFRTLSAYDLFRFHPSLMISPLKDTFDVWGERQVPSNVAIPSQDVPILFGSIHVEKPSHRLPVPTGQEIRIAALQAHIAVSDAMSLATGGGKPGLEIANLLTFTQIGVGGAITPTRDFSESPRLNQPLSARYQVKVQKPPFASDVIVAALTDLNGDRKSMIPTDVKVPVLASDPSTVSTVTLAAPKKTIGTEHVVTIAASKSPRMISGIFSAQPGSKVSPGAYLPGIPLPGKGLPATLKIQAPKTGVGCAVFDGVHPSGQNRPYPVWMVYTLPGAGTIDIPTAELAKKHQLKGYASIQLDFGPSFNESAVDGTHVVEQIQRFAASWEKI